MQRPDLAKTIKAIVEKGKDGFYKGWVGLKLFLLP